MYAAVDFGLSNTDVVVWEEHTTECRTIRFNTPATPENLKEILTEFYPGLKKIELIGVTGGRHKDLPDHLEGIPIYKVNEVEAIGRGGQQFSHSEEKSILVVSAGSGTSMVSARGEEYQHVGGTAVGGGTLLGLSRLLLNTIDPAEIDHLASKGDRHVADLRISDVISGPIGSLTADATAVNFGRLARENVSVDRHNLAASLVTMIGQTIALIAINIARAQKLNEIVIIGHLSDMQSMRKAISAVGDLYNTPIQLPHSTGHAIAFGALNIAENRHGKQ